MGGWVDGADGKNLLLIRRRSLSMNILRCLKEELEAAEAYRKELETSE